METLSEIVAQMRGRGEDGRMDRRLWLEYADRIEAAAERERAEVESDALAVGGVVEAARHKPGNAAAMRDAMVKIRGIAKTFMDATRMRHVTDSARIDVGEIEDLAQSALSAPARNCDLPLVVDGPADNNADKAWLVFKRHNPDAYFDVSGLLRCIDWLLAPAAERKGEGDGM